jgi:hypothetical protein
MKILAQIILFISICLVMASVSSAQIPNAGFESWTNGSPDNWDALSNYNIPGILVAINITQVTDAHSGNYAIRGDVINSSGDAYAPVLWAGQTQTGNGFPYSGQAALNGYYKFVPAALGDKFEISVITFKNAWLGGGIGYGSIDITAGATAYTKFSVPITNVFAGTPDSCFISFTIGNSNSKLAVGSYFIIDDLSFGAATDVQESPSTNPAVFALSQNYPNPFNPSTKISYQLPTEGLVRLEVYDIMGRTITTLVNEEKPAGQFTATFDASNFTSGIYFYRLHVIARNGNSFSQTNKMILMK